MNSFFIPLIIISQTFTEYIVFLKIINNDNNIKKNKKIFIFVVFLSQMFISNYVLPDYLRYVFTITIFTCTSHFILKKNLIESFVTSILTLILISIVEIIITIILFVIGIKPQQISENINNQFLLNMVISLLSILIINLKKILDIILNIKIICIKRKVLFKYIIIILIIIYLILAKNILFARVTLEMIINLIILFVSFLLFILIFISDNKNSQLEEANKQMLNYVTKYEKIIADQGKANHEFRNQLMVIRGYAQMNSPKLIEYLDSIVDDTKKTHSSYLISQLNKFPDGGIKGLLYYKLSIMDDENIKYEINVDTGVKTKLKSLDTIIYKNITKILGVLLDNSIDASKQSKNKRIIISVTNEKFKVIFNISNTYKGKIDVSKLSTGYTTKGKGHGYGLRLVKDIIDENENFEIQRSVDENYFVTNFNILIKRKKK